MAKEQFFYPQTQPLFKKLEQLSQRSSVSRGQAFEDWLTAMVCALAAETKEAEYQDMIERHKRGKQGQRGADLMAVMFGELVNAMSETDADILGDLFQGSVTYGEAGQFLSTQSTAELLAMMSVDTNARPTGDQRLLISDPCCGTGRMLLEASKVNPYAELFGQDIDGRCVKISAVNLGLRGRYGWVLCGNSLSGETQFAYRIGSFFNETANELRRGVIRDVEPEQTPVPVLADQMRRDTKDLFDQGSEASVPAEPTLPTIIEVPQWLARLEPRLAALDSRQPVQLPNEQSDEKCERVRKPEGDTEQTLPKQQRLF